MAIRKSNDLQGRHVCVSNPQELQRARHDMAAFQQVKQEQAALRPKFVCKAKRSIAAHS